MRNATVRRSGDALFGVIAFAFVMLVVFLTREHQDIRSFLGATAATFFVVGLFRSPWIAVCAGIAPAIAMNRLDMALTAPAYLSGYIAMVCVAAAAGSCVSELRARHRSQYALALACGFAVVAAGAIFAAIPNWLAGSTAPSVEGAAGRAIRPFRVQSLTGEAIASSDWKGRVVVLSMWATWCIPCQAELPQIAKLQERYKTNPDVLILALNTGNHGETADKAQNYLTNHGLSLTPAIDLPVPNEDSWGPAASSLGTTTLPAIYILDRAGRLRAVHTGFDASEPLVEWLTRQIDRFR